MNKNSHSAYDRFIKGSMFCPSLAMLLGLINTLEFFSAGPTNVVGAVGSRSNHTDLDIVMSSDVFRGVEGIIQEWRQGH